MLTIPWNKLKWLNDNWKATAKNYPLVGQPWPSGVQGHCINIGLKLWLWQSHESAAMGKIAVKEHRRMRCPVFLSHFYTLDFFPQKQLRSPLHNQLHGGWWVKIAKGKNKVHLKQLRYHDRNFTILLYTSGITIQNRRMLMDSDLNRMVTASPRASLSILLLNGWFRSAVPTIAMG
jgi:hypothetical protein